MKKLLVALFAVVLWVPALTGQEPSAAPMPSVTLPPELARVLRDYERAWQGRDAEALSQLFAEDGFVLARHRPPVRGRAAIKAAYAGSGGPLSLRALAYATSEGIGYIIGGYGASLGAADTGKFVLTLKRNEAGHWLIMSDMDNSNEPPREGPPSTPGSPPAQ